ncbi:hypothetical protein [Wolbachia endosymbiont of Litomosoides brasiliensis]|uniref:hypothetical protein n=1 Tax=Wolbachia endosymbiont of Litomosoides brasiliensis TaxID=1812117 RepID=UPI00158D61AC|nr:hypothetical protein [Wolbachia endosymbiont of Litomosoides brasiliensis]
MNKIKVDRKNFKKLNEIIDSIQNKSYSSLMNRGLAHIRKLDTSALKGIRTWVEVKLGRQNFYLYSVVNPENGESSILFALNENALYKFITSLSHSAIKQLCNVTYLTHHNENQYKIVHGYNICNTTSFNKNSINSCNNYTS